MDPETHSTSSGQAKTCQNCKQNFTIESEDFDFYKKIDVPPPTWCPECRLISRIIWRNEWILYRRKDNKTGEKIFSVYSDDAPVNVYHRDYWWSDKWDAIDYGRDYDWSKPFFEQVKDLIKEVPFPSGAVIEGVNSDYCQNYTRLKNCYMTFGSSYCEDCAYVIWGGYAKSSFDSHMIYGSELCYECLNINKCYRTFFSTDCEECQDVYFSKDCVGCSSCFGCIGLRNKRFNIFNKPYSKNGYFAEIEKIDIGSFKGKSLTQNQSLQKWLSWPHKFMHGRKNNNVLGEYIYNSKNVSNSWRISNSENCKYCQNLLTPTSRDCFDYTNWGQMAELVYNSLQCGENVYDVKFSVSSFPAVKSIYYSVFCASSSNLFACVGLRNKQYCILNKQYTKEEYEELVPKIIKHMNEMPYVDSKGRVYKYGEFFPPELSPFSYNETIAQEYFPLTKEEALKQGYRWKDPEPRNYTIDIRSEDLPDHIKDVKDDILGKVIECKNSSDARQKRRGRSPDQDASGCTEAFKIIPQELQFYRTMNLPLPRLCPNCRHYQRIRQRNPLKLWHRRCECAGSTSSPQAGTEYTYKNTADHIHHKKDEPCQNEFETTYAPQRPEIVYCEQCYLREVV